HFQAAAAELGGYLHVHVVEQRERPRRPERGGAVGERLEFVQCDRAAGAGCGGRQHGGGRHGVRRGGRGRHRHGEFGRGFEYGHGGGRERRVRAGSFHRGRELFRHDEGDFARVTTREGQRDRTRGPVGQHRVRGHSRERFAGRKDDVVTEQLFQRARGR